jgi:hypothetical protein
MCLSQEFFIDRDKIKEKYENKGYIDIDDLGKQHAITIKNLIDFGFLRKKKMCHTTELYDFRLTSLGKSYFFAEKRHQLILLKPNKLDKLMERLAEPTPTLLNNDIEGCYSSADKIIKVFVVFIVVGILGFRYFI